MNILTAGTFDTLHFGHLEFLIKASKLKGVGNLVVMLSTDEFNKEKGKESYFDYDKRKSFLMELMPIDIVVPETCWEDKERYIKEYNIDMFIIGDDWAGKFNDLSCDVAYLPRTKGISSTIIKKAL